jgi:hypothetical protein
MKAALLENIPDHESETPATITLVVGGLLKLRASMTVPASQAGSGR